MLYSCSQKGTEINLIFAGGKGLVSLVAVKIYVSKATMVLYRSIVDSLLQASSVSICKVKQNFYKFWWDEELTALKQTHSNCGRL